jgi:hypothetical protein
MSIDISIMPTSELWEATHKALCEHQWGIARALLDDLGLRRDNVDMLSSASQYGLTVEYGDFVNVIRDRIDLVNMKASNR